MNDKVFLTINGKTRELRATVRFTQILSQIGAGKADNTDAVNQGVIARLAEIVPAMMSTADREGVTEDDILDMDVEDVMAAITAVSEKKAKSSPAPTNPAES